MPARPVDATLALLTRSRPRHVARQNCFLYCLVGQPSPAFLFFKLIDVETQFPFANSISEFSRSQDPQRTLFGQSRHPRRLYRLWVSLLQVQRRAWSSLPGTMFPTKNNVRSFTISSPNTRPNTLSGSPNTSRIDPRQGTLHLPGLNLMASFAHFIAKMCRAYRTWVGQV